MFAKHYSSYGCSSGGMHKDVLEQNFIAVDIRAGLRGVNGAIAPASPLEGGPCDDNYLS